MLSLTAGFVIDLILGDPRGLPHIVRFIGALIKTLENIFYRFKNKRFFGGVLVFLVCLSCLSVSFFLSRFIICEIIIIWQCLAVKSLRIESQAVYKALKENDLQKARAALSMIVGRDTADLNEEDIIKAAVETIAENTSDGVIAPMFYIALFGAVGGFLYKAVNTMDSILGYKNKRYKDFGYAAAKLDDIFNYIPSRLCALLMIISVRDKRNALRIWKRDRHKHKSPNAAQTESVMAGALGVKLNGPAYYGGVLCIKPYIGDDTRPIEIKDIIKAHGILYKTAFLMFLLTLMIRGFVIWRLR